MYGGLSTHMNIYVPSYNLIFPRWMTWDIKSKMQSPCLEGKTSVAMECLDPHCRPTQFILLSQQMAFHKRNKLAHIPHHQESGRMAFLPCGWRSTLLGEDNCDMLCVNATLGSAKSELQYHFWSMHYHYIYMTLLVLFRKYNMTNTTSPSSFEAHMKNKHLSLWDPFIPSVAPMLGNQATGGGVSSKSCYSLAHHIKWLVFPFSNYFRHLLHHLKSKFW